MSGVFLSEYCLQYEISDILAKKILGKESVYITQSAYIANYSLLQSIVIPSKTHVYIDSNAHESLRQGASRGIIHKIKHNSLGDFKRNLDKYGNLVQICNLKEQYHCIYFLVVDEFHSIGMYGPNGRGLAALENVTDHIDFITGSLVKVYCVRAGFIAGQTKEVLYTREISSAAIFSTALMNWDMQRFQRAIDIVYHADNERERLLNISKIIRQNILMLEFNIEEPILPSPIICIIGGPNEYTKKLQIYFENAEISAAIFIPPATPSGQTMLRITFHAGLSDQDVTRIIDTFKFITQHRLEFPYTFKLSRHR